MELSLFLLAALLRAAAGLQIPAAPAPQSSGRISAGKVVEADDVAVSFASEVARRRLKLPVGPAGGGAYLATLSKNRVRTAPPRLEIRGYLDELDDNRIFKSLALELENRDLLEVDYCEGGPCFLDDHEPGTENLLAWQGAMLFTTVAWATNFAVTAYACADVSAKTGLDASTAAAAFVVGRFGLAALSTAPFLAGASSAGAVAAGARIGLLYAMGYAAQAAALAHGFPAANCAFVCSLQCVAVALLAPGETPLRSWAGVALAVGGVACLELFGASEAAPVDGIGLLLALGQPLAFGASYVDLEKAMDEHPEDSAAMSALQCLVIFASAAGALVLAAGGPDAALGAAAAVAAHADAPLLASLAWTGLVSTSFTIWLCAQAFKRLPAVDASLILTSEPLWAALVAAGLLGDRFGASDAAGGALILLACAVNDELIPLPFLSADDSTVAA